MILIAILLLIILSFDNIKQSKCNGGLFFPSVYNVKKAKNKEKEIAEHNSRHLPRKFLVRQVPGDGSCLFNALAICVSHEFTKKVSMTILHSLLVF